uniref:Uncharacterized protein n=1 Tax=Tanacetum cinerariifolium TaxID=118510 RepID=A0A6L2KSD3_TANCI|nr:hypothetical protein [Tanacetum cinerariifolium]
MAKKDMDLYHSRLTLDDLNDLIIKYKIPHDLHPRLPSEEFVMFELPDHAIGFSRLYANKKSGFFLIDRRAILDAMVWRHPNAAIDDPRPAAGSFNMADSCVCDLVLRDANGNVISIYDFLYLPAWTGAEVQEEPHSDVSPTLQRLLFYCTPPAADEAVIPDPTSGDLVVGTPSFKIVAKAEVIPSFGNQGRSFIAPTAEGSNTRHSRGKGVMVDDAAAPSSDFFPFFAGPYYATYPEGGVAGNYKFTHEKWDAPYRPTFRVLTKEVFKDPAVCKSMVDQFPTPGEMVRVESLSDDQLTMKMSVIHCMMRSYGAALKKQVSRLNNKLTSSNASFAKSKDKGKEMKKNIKSLGKSLDNLHAEVACLYAPLNQATILEAERDEEILRLKTTPPDLLLVAQTDYAFLNKIFEYTTKPLSVILHLEPEKLVCSANVSILRGTCVSPPIAKESTVTPVSESLKLYANVNFTAFTVTSDHNEEMLNAKVDGSNPKITDDTTAVKSGHAFVQGIFVALDDVTELVEVGSGHVPSGPDDVVVTFSAHEKGDGLNSSSTAGEGRVVCQRTLVASSLGQTDSRCVVAHPVDPESCHPP